MSSTEELVQQILPRMAEDAPRQDMDDLERRIAEAARGRTAAPSVPGTVDIEITLQPLVDASSESAARDQRRLRNRRNLIILAGSMAAVLIGVIVLATGVLGDSASVELDGTAAESAALPETSPYWSQVPFGPLFVDLSPLVDPSAPSAAENNADGAVDPYSRMVIDVTVAPSGWTLRQEFARPLGTFREPSLEQAQPYEQSVSAGSRGKTATLYLSGLASVTEQQPPWNIDGLADVLGLGPLEPAILRGTEGRVGADVLLWVENETAFILLESSELTAAEMIALADELEFTEVDALPDPIDPSFLQPGGTWEPQSNSAIIGPMADGTEWGYDDSEVLVLNGVPVGTGRNANLIVEAPVAILSVAGGDMVIAGAVPASMVSLRVVTERGTVAPLPAPVSVLNDGNRLFAFGVPLGLDAVRAEFLAASGEVVAVLPLTDVRPGHRYSTPLEFE